MVIEIEIISSEVEGKIDEEMLNYFNNFKKSVVFM